MEIKNQSPNMFVTYPTSGEYDLVMVNWYCETDALNTYWAVHQFSTDTVDGYAGFQNSGNDHILMFSIWDHGTNYPVVEYVSDKTRLDNLNFGNEGTGKHIVTDFDWEVGKWYTMCIGTKTVSGKTYYAQWIAEKGNSNWFLCGVISYPVSNRYIGSDLMFQEDFTFNNLTKKCRLQNAFGHYKVTNTWHKWNTYVISNNFYRYKETTSPVENFKYDCDHGKVGTEYIYIQSGGEDLFNEPVERPMTLPDTIELSSDPSPSASPVWASLAPRYIKSKFSNLYVNPGNNNTVIQSGTLYYWNFVDSGDGYFYILSEDKTLAITITGTDKGNELILAPFNSLDTQKWTNKSVLQSEYVYFFPKNAAGMNMDVRGPSTASGAVIQLWTHSDADQFKWLTLNTSVHYAIKSYFSGLYVNPSGNGIVQLSKIYMWNFISAGDDYYYILSLDNVKAITVDGNNDGSDLAYADFNPGNDKQKWKLISAGDSTFNIVPKSDIDKNMDIEGPVTTEGANIQLWTRQTGVSQFRWRITN